MANRCQWLLITGCRQVNHPPMISHDGGAYPLGFAEIGGGVFSNPLDMILEARNGKGMESAIAGSCSSFTSGR